MPCADLMYRAPTSTLHKIDDSLTIMSKRKVWQRIIHHEEDRDSLRMLRESLSDAKTEYMVTMMQYQTIQSR
jgi:hypothetical protein